MSLARCRQLTDDNVPDALVTGFDALVPTLSVSDLGDRHVLAAAIHGGADCIVTFNLKHFPSQALSPYQIEAIHPDDFITQLLDASPELVCLAARHQRATLKNPPKTATELLGNSKRWGCGERPL